GGRIHHCSEVGCFDVGTNKIGFKKRMDAVLCGVSVWIGPDPAVVLNRSVQRLSCVRDVMAEPTGVKDDCLLNGGRGLVRGLETAIFAEGGLEAAVNLHRDVRLKSNALGEVVVRVIGGCGALFVKLAVKLIAPAGQRIEPCHAFEIDEMIGLLGILQGILGGIAPAIGFGPEVGDLDHGASQELGHCCGNLLGGDAVHKCVAIVAPGEGEIRLQKDEDYQRQADESAQKSIHCHPPEVAVIRLEHQVHAQLQKARAANRVLNQSQAALRGNRCGTFVIGEEGHVVVWSVEIRMVENVEGIGFKPELEALFNLELLGEVHVEAYLEWTSEDVPARISE